MKTFKTTFATLVLILVASITLSACTGQNKDTAFNDKLTSAASFYDQKQYTQALTAYNDASEIYPKRYEPYIGIIQILTDKNLLDKSTEILDKSSTQLASTELASLYTTVAQKYYDQMDWTNAQTNFKKANDLDSSNLDAKLGLVKSYISLGDRANAAKYAEISDDKAENGKDKYAELILLNAYLKLEDITAAREQTNRLDGYLFESQNLKAQFDSYIATLGQTNADAELYSATLLSKEYINYGYPLLASEVLSKYKDQMYEYSDGMYFLGLAYFNAGKYSDAQATLAEAALISDSYEIKWVLARAYALDNNQDKATQQYEMAYDFSPETKKSIIAQEYVSYLMKKQLYVQAKVFLNKVETLFVESWVSFSYCDLYFEQKDLDKMKFHLDVLSARIDLSPADQMRLYSLKTQYFFETGELDSAKAQIDSMESTDKFNPEVYLLRGRYYLLTGENDLAKEALIKAIEYDLVGDVSDSATKLLARVE